MHRKNVSAKKLLQPPFTKWYKHRPRAIDLLSRSSELLKRSL